MKNLKGKNILITAGPTWAAIDEVRVISNTASGLTGILLAEKLAERKANVTLLLGPVNLCCLNKGIKVLRYDFFAQLKDLITRELKSKKYDCAVHSAAVCDYLPKRKLDYKVKSGRGELNIALVPAPKIIDRIKSIQPELCLIGFKFEPRSSKLKLINAAKKLLKRANADYIVANTINNNNYSAYIVGEDKVSGLLFSKKQLVNALASLV